LIDLIQRSEIFAHRAAGTFALAPIYSLRARNAFGAIGISLDDARVNSKAFALNQAFGHAAAADRLENVTQRAAISKTAMAILGECRMIGNGIFQTKPAEPAIRQVQMNLFAKAALGTECRSSSPR
jgi:hypothetical protein